MVSITVKRETESSSADLTREANCSLPKELPPPITVCYSGDDEVVVLSNKDKKHTAMKCNLFDFLLTLGANIPPSPLSFLSPNIRVLNMRKKSSSV